jgi:hypothetical protein
MWDPSGKGKMEDGIDEGKERGRGREEEDEGWKEEEEGGQGG